jgi:hypothetical protein
MQVLKRETTIPVPEILQFDNSLNNELNCPYILMEHVDGIPLQDSWFDHRVSHDILEQRRVTTLRQVAAAMIQLDKFTYGKGGQVAYSKDGHSTTVGPMKCMDSAAELARLETDDTDLTPIFCELGPFEDQSSFLLSLLNRRNSPPDEYSRGINEMLRLFISWIPNSNANEFVLSHPDFDMQNVLVAEDGSLRSLIDWDGVAAVPRVVGNRSYPGWITRDWDPAKYAWDEDAEPNETVKENSPEELAHYRDIYADAVGSAVSTSDLPISLTRNSLIVENVRIAADDPFSTHGIVERIFHEITKLVAPEILEECPMDDGELEEDEDGESTHGKSNAESTANEQDDTAHSSADEDEVGGDDLGASSNSGFYSYEVAIDLASGKLDQKRLGMLKDGFLRLFMQCSPQAVQPRPGPLGLAWWAGLVGLVLAPFRLGKRDAGEEKK